MRKEVTISFFEKNWTYILFILGVGLKFVLEVLQPIQYEYPTDIVINIGFYLIILVLLIISKRKLLKGLKFRVALWLAVEEIRTLSEANPANVREKIFRDQYFFVDDDLQIAFDEYKHNTKKTAEKGIEDYISQKLLEEAIGVKVLERISRALMILTIVGPLASLLVGCREINFYSFSGSLGSIGRIFEVGKIAVHMLIIGFCYWWTYGFIYNRQLTEERRAIATFLDMYHKHVGPVTDNSAINKSKKIKVYKSETRSGVIEDNEIKTYCSICGCEVNATDEICSNCGMDIRQMEVVSGLVEEEDSIDIDAAEKSIEKKSGFAQCKKVVKILWDGLFSLILAYAAFMGCRCYRVIYMEDARLFASGGCLFIYFILIVFTFLCHKLLTNKSRIIKYALLIAVVLSGSNLAILEWRRSATDGIIEVQMPEDYEEYGVLWRSDPMNYRELVEQALDGFEKYPGLQNVRVPVGKTKPPLSARECIGMDVSDVIVQFVESGFRNIKIEEKVLEFISVEDFHKPLQLENKYVENITISGKENFSTEDVFEYYEPVVISYTFTE